MRTPNTKCQICSKPLYRRTYEIKRARYFACIDCRSIAAKQYPLTDKQIASLELGRGKGKGGRLGKPHSEDTKRKIAEAHKRWCQENPEKVKQRGEKLRGENHYLWQGGINVLNQKIRRLNDNRKWQRAVKQRDGFRCKCGATEKLEANHIIPLSVLIQKNNIKSTEDARNCPALWDISNGETLCQKCHYQLEGRNYAN